jgi:multimeric flavodoxin WrbA
MSDSVRPTVAIAFHSGYGHTAVIAEAVARGAAEAGAEVVSISVDHHRRAVGTAGRR